MNRILVPVNLRSDFENLLKYAASVGQRSGAEITLFYYGGRRLFRGSSSFVHEGPSQDLLSRVKGSRFKQPLEQLLRTWDDLGLHYRLKVVRGRSVSEITRESRNESYDLVIMGSHHTQHWSQYLRGTLAQRVIGTIQAPVFVVPAESHFNDIQHITYAVDLSDYDASVIQQVKSIARLFDAKLSITHVNVETQPEHKEQYLQTLERTISDTLDYPKVMYKFFDHADPLGGIVKFVNLHNSHLIAMINRKKFSWRNLFADKSVTRRITSKVSVPILTFHK